MVATFRVSPLIRRRASASQCRIRSTAARLLRPTAISASYLPLTATKRAASQRLIPTIFSARVAYPSPAVIATKRPQLALLRLLLVIKQVDSPWATLTHLMKTVPTKGNGTSRRQVTNRRFFYSSSTEVMASNFWSNGAGDRPRGDSHCLNHLK